MKNYTITNDAERVNDYLNITVFSEQRATEISNLFKSFEEE